MNAQDLLYDHRLIDRIGEVITKLNDNTEIFTKISIETPGLSPQPFGVRFYSRKDNKVANTHLDANTHLETVMVHFVPGFFSSRVTVMKTTEVEIYNSFANFFITYPKYLQIFEEVFKQIEMHQQQQDKEQLEFKQQVQELLNQDPTSMILSDNKFFREYGKQLLIDDNN